MQELAWFLLFLGVLAVAVCIKRKSLEIRGLMILYKTKKFRRMIDGIANVSPKIWKIIGNLAVAVCVFFMIYGSVLIFETSLKTVTGEMKESGVKLILPAPVKATETGYAYILLPFWLWICVVFFIIVPHELFHGVLARSEKIPLKSVGLLLFLIFPGAFVEIDEKILKRKKLLQKLRVLAAGSFANFVVALLAFLLGTALWNLCAEGVAVEKIFPGSPAEKAGIEKGEIIKSINGIPVVTSFDRYAKFTFSKNPEKLTASFSILEALTNGTFANYSFKPGDRIWIKTNKRNYTLTLGEHPEIKGAPYIGITANLALSFPDEFFRFLSTLSALSLAVGVVNVLPIYPLDGGQMVRAFLEEKLGKKKAEKMTKGITFFFVFLILLSVFAPIF